MAKANRTPSTLTAEQISRFWSYIGKAGPDDCWLWLRGKGKAGYGIFHPVHGISILTHRLAWSLSQGPIPPGQKVCHNCPTGDNPACCNPSHLFLGTQGDNLRDAFAKGRMKARDANPVCKGSRHGNSKLNDDVVRAMRAEYALGQISQDMLALKHGVSQSTAWAILRRRAWKHVTD